jgi:hypothetical protein
VPSAPNLTMGTAGSSPSARTTGNRTPAVPPSAFRAAGVVSSPGSASDEVPCPFGTAGCFCFTKPPPPLTGLDADAMLAVAAVPGKVLEEWRHADFGVWIAWPHAVDAGCAEEMTAAQLRDLLAKREDG